jgi:hypothetical protein
MSHQKSNADKAGKQLIPNKGEPRPGQKQLDSNPDKEAKKKILPTKRDDDGRELLHG